MNLIKFIVWLSAGAVIGWFASRMDKVGDGQKTQKPIPGEEQSTEKS